MIQQNNSWAVKRDPNKTFLNNKWRLEFSRKLNKLNRANSNQNQNKSKLPRTEADLNCRALKHKNNKVCAKAQCFWNTPPPSHPGLNHVF